MSEIARLLIAQGENAARAREASGAIWGNAIANVSQIPGQVLAAQQQRQDRAQTQALATARETREAAGAADQHALQTAQLEKMRQASASDWAEKLRVSGATPEVVQSEIDAQTGKLWTPEESVALKTLASTPEGTTQLLTRLAPAQEPKVTEADPSKDVIDNRTGKLIRAGRPAVPKTMAEIAFDAANPNSPTQAQSTTALDLSKPPKPEPVARPLEQQLLEAVASGDTAKIGQIKQTMLTAAQARRDPDAAATARELAGLRVDEARARLDAQDTGSDKNQQKFEQQYRTVLQRAFSSRAGGIGAEDAKVQQANHLLSAFDQFYDPKTDTWNIPKTQLAEVALGLAKLTAPGGNAGVQMMDEFNQRTAKGDIAGALTYLTGQPVAANTQAIAKMLKESIERQGQTAEQNREGSMSGLRQLAPTDLAEDRRAALEKASLNPLRQSRVIQNKATGERKLQVSIDGGATWK